MKFIFMLALTQFIPLAQAASLSICVDQAAHEDENLAISHFQGDDLYLQVHPNEESADCESIELSVPEEALIWGRVVRSALLADPGASIILQGQFDEDTVNVSEVIVPEPVAASTPVTVNPQNPVRPPAEEIQSYRSAWFWQPAWWMQTPEQLWAISAAENLDRLYITVPVIESAVSNPELLRDFLAASHDLGLEVWAVVGDRRDVLEASLLMLLSRTSAYREYNRSVPEASALDGMQLDIEPYLLPGFNLDQDHFRERYILTIKAVHELLAEELPLDLVMPVWWGAHRQWGNRLFNQLTLPGLSVTVMNYRTEIDRLRQEAMPFLSWGESGDVNVQMALEYGQLPDETRQHFYPANRGELWQFSIG